MRDIIPFIDQIKEMDVVLEHITEISEFKWTLFEDNNEALEVVWAPRYRPRTKHFAIKYHHFREHVKNGIIEIQPIDTKDQIADHHHHQYHKHPQHQHQHHKHHQHHHHHHKINHKPKTSTT